MLRQFISSFWGTTTISLVFAVGAQNTYILRQTIIKQWVLPIILL